MGSRGGGYDDRLPGSRCGFRRLDGDTESRRKWLVEAIKCPRIVESGSGRVQGRTGCGYRILGPFYKARRLEAHPYRLTLGIANLALRPV